MNRIFRKKRVRALCAQAVAVLCLACLCVPWNAAPALAAGSFRAEPVTAADLYNGGYYIKLLKASNGVYGMSATGGRIVELDALPEEARDYSTGGKDWRGLRGRGENDRYCHIYPHLVNNRDSEGWHYIGGNGDAFAFVSDGDSKDNGAVGGRFSVTWKKAGVLRSTKGKLGAENELPEGGIYVDIRVDSTLVNTVDTSSWLFTSPKAVVQFTNRFDWGFFQLGVTRMDQTFTFIDSETGSEVPINGPLSVLESSLDQGEGFMIQGASASRVSSTAPATNTHAGNVPAGILEATRWSTIPGSYLYEVDEGGWLGYFGAPQVKVHRSHLDIDAGTVGKSNDDDPLLIDYVDNKFNSRRFFTLDGVRYPTDYAPGSLNPNAETYVWRSASIEKNLRGASTIDVRSYAVGYNGWPSDTTTLDATASDAGTIRGIGSGSSNSVNPSLDTVPEGYNPEFPNNGVRYYTVAFAGTYGAQPPEPVKTVSDHRARALGEAVTFSISQEVNTYGEDLFTPYQSFVIHDTIDANLDYVSAKLVYTAPESSKKTDVTAAAGALSYDQSKRMVGYAFSKDYLQASRVGENTDPTSAMVYRGGTYTLEIQAKVKSDAKAQLSNTGFSTINGMEKSTEEVSVVVGAASVDLAKSVKFEHAVGDEATYTIALENPRAGTVARNVHISDKLPDGLVPVEGSLVSSGVPTDAIVQAVKDNKVVAETVSNSSARAQLEGASLSATIPFLPADKVVTYSLKVKCSEANNGKEFFNTATATIENPSSGSEGSVSATDGLWVNNAVLKVDKQADAFEYGVGDTVSYTVVLRNTAEGTIARDVKIEDATLPPYLKLDPKSVKVTGLPDPVSYPVDGSGVHKAENRTNKHTLATSGNGFVVSIPYLPAGAPVTVTYTATALEAGNGKETVNTVKATCANPLDPKTKTEASDGIWVNAVKLDVLKRADAFEYRTGDTVTYLLTLTNNGPAGTIARDVVLTDDLPDRVAFDQGSVHVEGVAAKVAYPVDGKGQHREEERAGSYVLTEAGNGFTLRIPYLPSGQTATVTYTATATRDSNGLETFNSATAQPANPLPGSESATSKDGVWTNEAVLALSKEVETYEYQVGSEVRYAVRYRNIAPGTVARDVVMEDVSLPSGMRLQPESIAVEGVPETVAYLADGDGLHSEEQRDNPYKVEVDGNAFAVSHPYLPAGADVTVSYTAVPTEEVNGDEIVNTAKVEASNMLDGIGAEDSAVVWVNTPRLLVTKHALETRVAYKQGDVVTYRIQVDNEAAGTFARNVGIDDLFQVEGMQLLRSSVVVFDAEGSLVDPGAYQVAQRMSDANWSVPTTLNLVSTAGNHGVWEEGARHESEQLNPLGESKQERVFVEFQASVTAAELDGREVTNVAGAWADNAEKAFDEEAILVDLPKPEPEPQPDPQPEPQPLGHLSVVKFSDPKSGQPVKAGDTIEYTLLASNQGDAPVEGVAVYDEVPVGTTFASMDENDHGSVDDQGRAVRWLIETIEPGKTIALRFKVTVDPDLDDFYQIRNQATYAQDRTELPDGPLPTPTNDVVNPVQVDDGPAVVVRKASDPEHNTKVVPGQEITYSLTAINTGARTAAYTVVRDYLPAGTTFVEGSIEGEGVFVPATAIGDQDIDPATESEAPVAASAQEGEGGQSVDNAGVYGGEESDGPGSDVDERGADAHGSQASESREGRSAQEASEEFGNQKADGEPGSEESNDQEAKGRQQSDRAYVEFLVRDLEVGDSAAQTVSFRVKVGDNPVALVENSALFNVVESEPTLGDPDTSEPEQQTNTVIHPVEPRPASPVDPDPTPQDDPADDSDEKPAPEPTAPQDTDPSPDPETKKGPSSDPTASAQPGNRPDPAPMPAPSASSQPSSTPAPQPDSSSSPSPQPEPQPEPAPSSDPSSDSNPQPEPQPEPAPSSASQPKPGSSLEPGPEQSSSQPSSSQPSSKSGTASSSSSSGKGSSTGSGSGSGSSSATSGTKASGSGGTSSSNNLAKTSDSTHMHPFAIAAAASGIAAIAVYHLRLRRRARARLRGRLEQ